MIISMQRVPESVLYAMQTLENQGGEAYLVGGCVRDMLLRRPVHDWDICTSLRPETVMELFPKTIPSGLKHGTVTVLSDGLPLEVTTFRREGEYVIHRAPEQVTFADSIGEDLCRRDLTINAMAVNVRGCLVDLYSGLEDLQAGIIRCVGDPVRRFTEDALRILRTVRFSAQLGFTLSQDTLDAISACSSYCDVLSAERVCTEVEKALLSDHPQKLSILIEFGILDRFGIRGAIDFDRLASVSPRRETRWAMLLALCPNADLKKLRLERNLILFCEKVLQSIPLLRDAAGIKQAACDYGRDAVACAGELFHCDDHVQAVLNAGECIVLKELAVSGADFPQIRGKAVGELLRGLLTHVWNHPEDNNREALLRRAEVLLLIHK